MNIGYAIWLERLDSPIIKCQVIEVLEKISMLIPGSRFYMFAFQPIYRILSELQPLIKLKEELNNIKINLIIIPTFTPYIPKPSWFSAKWYMLLPILLQTAPVFLFLILIKKIEILHCRSYPIMIPVIVIKKIIKHLKIVFDSSSPWP